MEIDLNSLEITKSINREAVVQRKIDWVDEDGSPIKIGRGEKIKVIGYSWNCYCHVCEYNGMKFSCVDIYDNKKDWKEEADPNTDIFVLYI